MKKYRMIQRTSEIEAQQWFPNLDPELPGVCYCPLYADPTIIRPHVHISRRLDGSPIKSDYAGSSATGGDIHILLEPGDYIIYSPDGSASTCPESSFRNVWEEL